MLTIYEDSIRQRCNPAPDIHEKAEIVLLWPPNWIPQWYGEPGVHAPSEMADWLEHAWEQMRQWTGFDPNVWHAGRNGERHRLVFACDGRRDFVFGGVTRPCIGLRDGRNPSAGSEEWFGWLCHELAHDFFHQQRVNTSQPRWGEGMCDYSRYCLLGTIGMPGAARHWEESLYRAAATDRYKAAARMILDFERQNNLSSPREVWRRLWQTDFDQMVGQPTW